jgi:hypothetical protein
MTDKELLELAAKASQVIYEKRYVEPDGLKFQGLLLNIGIGHQPTQWWNPLDDDGDAFRLAVKLNLFDGLEKRASYIASTVNYDMDPRDATRRAIVLAAAEIGKSMK